jgi:hypothetical protein
MDRDTLIGTMTDLLRMTIVTQGGEEIVLAHDSPLLGPNAIVTSLGLVSFIMDVEATLADEHGVEVTLVNEAALSRSRSPFRSVEALADYVLELTGAAPEAQATA